MSFFLHRTARGRKNVVKAPVRSFDPAIYARLPRSAQEIASLLGVSEPADWFWSESDKGSGYFYVQSTNEKYITQSGLISYGFPVNVLDSFKNGAATIAMTSKAFASNVSFAIVFVHKIEHYSGTETNSGLVCSVGGSTAFQCYPWSAQSRFVIYATTPEAGGLAVSIDTYLPSGALNCLIFGWDARTRKFWGTLNGNVVSSGDTISSVWSGLNFYFDKRDGTWSAVQLATFSSTSAETIRDNAVANRTTLMSMFSGNGKITSSCSSIYHKTSSTSYDVSLLNKPYSDENGLLIHPAIQNLMINSRGMKDWTLDKVTKKDWMSIAADGMRSLTGIYETVDDAEHNATIAVTPVATGRHWFEFTCRMSLVAGVSVEILNGTDASYVSFDVDGNDTNYVSRTSGTIFSTLGYRLFRVKVPIDITVLDALTITARCLKLDGEDWDVSYVGVATNVLYMGDWSLCLSIAEPLVLPISMGSASTAIAPIVDLTDSVVLERIKNGRLTAKVSISINVWPQFDLCIWVWRKNATNGVEVWLRYQGTLDNLRLYKLSVVSIADGTSTETIVSGNSWVLQNDYSSTRVERIAIYMSIDSSGLAKWWARSEAGDEITQYEDDIVTSGENSIAGYVSTMVPTSIRLGSNIGGTGQQSMTISEVSSW